jgi:hypothetical protein
VACKHPKGLGRGRNSEVIAGGVAKVVHAASGSAVATGFQDHTGHCSGAGIDHQVVKIPTICCTQGRTWKHCAVCRLEFSQGEMYGILHPKLTNVECDICIPSVPLCSPEKSSCFVHWHV